MLRAASCEPRRPSRRPPAGRRAAGAPALGRRGSGPGAGAASYEGLTEKGGPAGGVAVAGDLGYGALATAKVGNGSLKI
jgi:hypothetical protein